MNLYTVNWQRGLPLSDVSFPATGQDGTGMCLLAVMLFLLGLIYASMSYFFWKRHYDLVIFSHFNPLLHRSQFASGKSADCEKGTLDDGKEFTISLEVYANAPCYTSAFIQRSSIMASLQRYVVFLFSLASLLFAEILYTTWAIQFLTRLYQEQMETGSIDHEFVRDEFRFALFLLMASLVLKGLHVSAVQLGFVLAHEVRYSDTRDATKTVETKYKRIFQRIAIFVILASTLAGFFWFGLISANGRSIMLPVSKPSIAILSSPETITSATFQDITLLEHQKEILDYYSLISYTIPESTSKSSVMGYFQVVLCGLVIFGNLVLCFFERGSQFIIPEEGVFSSSNLPNEATNSKIPDQIFTSLNLLSKGCINRVGPTSTSTSTGQQDTDRQIYKYIFDASEEQGSTVESYLVYHLVHTSGNLQHHTIFANIPCFNCKNNRSISRSLLTDPHSFLDDIPSLAKISYCTPLSDTQLPKSDDQVLSSTPSTTTPSIITVKSILSALLTGIPIHSQMSV